MAPMNLGPVLRKRALVVALLLGASASVAGQNLTITTFDVPGAGNASGQGTSVSDINLFGVIAGSYTDPNNVSHSFIRRPNGRITTFDPPGTASVPYPQFNGSGVFALNAEGTVGGYTVDANFAVHAYLRSHDGKFTIIDWPGSCTMSQDVGCHGSGVWSINDFGVSTGPFEDTSGNFVAHTAKRSLEGAIITFEVPGSSMLAGQGTLPGSPSGLNNRGAITGLWYDANYNFHGFLRSPGGHFIDFEAPGADVTDAFYGTFPNSVNDLGAIVGYYLDANSVYHGFLRKPDGSFASPLDAPGADLTPGNFNGTIASTINAFGEITGYYTDVNGATHGFVRAPNGGYKSFDVPGASQGTIPVANNLFGAITGFYVDANGVSHGFVAIPCFDDCGGDTAAQAALGPAGGSLKASTGSRGNTAPSRVNAVLRILGQSPLPK